jgi:nucleoside-triphosphatase THEP1
MAEAAPPTAADQRGLANKAAWEGREVSGRVASELQQDDTRTGWDTLDEHRGKGGKTCTVDRSAGHDTDMTPR